MSSVKKAYIIDDEESICLLLGGLLKRENIESDYSVSLKDSVIKAKKFHPDIIFLDLSLKDGSGFSIIPDLRRELPEAEIILISAHDGQKEQQRAREHKIKHFLSKPLNSELILNIIKQI